MRKIVVIHTGCIREMYVEAKDIMSILDEHFIDYTVVIKTEYISITITNKHNRKYYIVPYLAY